MAETVRLNDGTVEYIFDDKPVFLKRLIEEKLGPEAACCFSECIFEMQEKLKYTRESCTEHEKSADGYVQGLQNIREMLDCLEYRAKTVSRFTRKDVFTYIENVKKEISNYI